MTIKLHAFGPAWGIADPSPFCLKLESFLKEAKIAHVKAPFDPRRSFAKAPKGKLPFIEDEDGRVIGDSTLIIAHLARRHAVDLDAALTPAQRGVSLACRRMLDEHLYWVGVYSRWFDEPGWSIVRAAFFDQMPLLPRTLMVPWQRRRMAGALKAQGLGRHTRDEIYRLGEEDIAALAALLGDDAYFFATRAPTLLDLWAHAFVAEIIYPPIPSPLREATLATANLVAHCRRLQARLYPELAPAG